MKKIVKAIMFGLAVLGATSAFAAPKAKSLILATKFLDSEETAMSLRKVEKAINERGKSCNLSIKMYPGLTYAKAADCMEQITQGANVISCDGINFIAEYVPDYDAVTGPFLYADMAEYLAMTKTKLVKDLNAKAAKQGIHVLSLDYVFGFRSMMTNKVIAKPADMKGLKIRVPESKVYAYTLEALGATPIAMPYVDTYSAIQQKVIDGVEGSISTYWGTKQYENVKNYSLTNHILGVSGIAMSESYWKKLSKEQQQILAEEFEKGAKDLYDVTMAKEGEMMEQLKAVGVKVNTVDTPAFSTACASVYSKKNFPKWSEGIFDKIQAELKVIRSKK